MSTRRFVLGSGGGALTENYVDIHSTDCLDVVSGDAAARMAVCYLSLRLPYLIMFLLQAHGARFVWEWTPSAEDLTEEQNISTVRVFPPEDETKPQPVEQTAVADITTGWRYALRTYTSLLKNNVSRYTAMTCMPLGASVGILTRWVVADLFDFAYGGARAVPELAAWVDVLRMAVREAYPEYAKHFEDGRQEAGGDPEIACINYLTKDEGDSCHILCQNPDPEEVQDNFTVWVNGDWCGWVDVRYRGETRLAALTAAVAARREKENRKT